MWKFSSDLYRQRVARAWKIVNSRQAEQDIKSNTKLSVLAISFFSGMDGIESGQGIGVEDTEMGVIESGGTGVGLVDQDV